MKLAMQLNAVIMRCRRSCPKNDLTPLYLTELVVVAGGSMTGQRYRDDIVIPYIEEYAHNCGAGFVLMHDNALPHIASIVITN
jgi:hypothetical protein